MPGRAVECRHYAALGLGVTRFTARVLVRSSAMLRARTQTTNSSVPVARKEHHVGADECGEESGRAQSSGPLELAGEDPDQDRQDAHERSEVQDASWR